MVQKLFLLTAPKWQKKYFVCTAKRLSERAFVSGPTRGAKCSMVWRQGSFVRGGFVGATSGKGGCVVVIAISATDVEHVTTRTRPKMLTHRIHELFRKLSLAISSPNYFTQHNSIGQMSHSLVLEPTTVPKVLLPQLRCGSVTTYNFPTRTCDS